MKKYTLCKPFPRALMMAMLAVTLPTSLSLANESGDKKTNSVVELSIIGNSELPQVSFNLPWRLPSVEKREDQAPSKELPRVLDLIEPDRHKKMVHFSRYLEVDIPEFKTR